ncbi:MAG TPA: glycosyltransferase family 1 protein [Candidatus Paceibacterota bacterium]
MKIGIVLHPYGEAAPAGLGRAIYEITRSLIERDQKNHYIVYLRTGPAILPTFAGTNWEIKILRGGFFWLDRGLWGEKLDGCIFNTPIMPLFVKPKRSMVIVYDFAYHYFGRHFWLSQLNRFSLKKADHIVAISEYTKRETMKLFNIRPEKISVIYLGFKNFCENSTTPPPAIPGKFFLFIGVIKERKNVLGVLQAFNELKKKGNTTHALVIVGKGVGSYYDQIISYRKEHNLENDVKMIGRVTDEELAHYYKHAEALVFPSFIEGFGFPVLEAFACGTPVITSTTGSLPEAAGDAALLVDPADSQAIAGAMELLVSDQRLRDSLIAKGRVQMQKFSWDKMAKAYLDLLAP